MIGIMIAATLGAQSAALTQPLRRAEKIETAPASEKVTLTARDGVKVFSDYYASPRPKALILLFHQAGSSAGEYRAIAPRLVAAGYSALAIDQRSGGGMYGPNRTVAKLGQSSDHLAARPDMQAALDWAQIKSLPIVLWGSSYSASLIFPLAANGGARVKALLAFSPGEYFDDEALVSRAAAKVTVPVFVFAAPSKEERDYADPVFQAVGSKDKTRFVPRDGVHGSSTLIKARNPEGAESNWAAVMAFLTKAI